MDLNVGKWDGSPLRFREMLVNYVLTDGTSGGILIKNITNRGMGCQCESLPVQAGQEIGIDLPFLGLRTGIVRWTKDGHCGIEMAQPLDVDCLTLSSHIASPAPKQTDTPQS